MFVYLLLLFYRPSLIAIIVVKLVTFVRNFQCRIQRLQMTVTVQAAASDMRQTFRKITNIQLVLINFLAIVVEQQM